MESCPDVLLITALACKIAESLDDAELKKLAADTIFLSNVLGAILLHRKYNRNDEKDK